MSLLDKASLVCTPNAYKTSKLYSIIPTNGNGDMTFSRATTATRDNSSGLVELVGNNIPRLEYYGSCPSILLEPQRTNLLTYSEMFADVIWLKPNSTISANVTTSPDGTLTADRFSANGINATHQLTQSITFTTATNYTFSMYAKADTNNFIQLVLPGAVFGVNAWANFNVLNGTIGTVGSASTANIVNVGNGWFRCSITAPATVTILSTIIANIVTSSTSIRSEANTLTTSLFIWGAQLEVGAYITSYIPTTATVLTRNADIISIDNIYTNGLIISAGGTWFVELDNNFSLVRDSASNGLSLGDVIVTVNGFVIKNSGVLGRLIIQKVITSPTTLYTTLTDSVKILIKWNGVTADIFVNGIKVVTSTVFTTTAMEYLQGSASDVPKYIKSMMLFPTPLTDDECAYLTTL